MNSRADADDAVANSWAASSVVNKRADSDDVVANSWTQDAVVNN